MLETLHIRNLALVSELEVSFRSGLNVITGETGAGKSLIIGAVQLLTGGRATPSIIRKGTKQCEISGEISLADMADNVRQDISDRLSVAGITPCEDGLLLLRRVVTESGSRAYVNMTPVTIGFLREIGTLLIDIHGPHDNQSLLLPHYQLKLVDMYAANGPRLDSCRRKYDELREISHELDELATASLAPEDVELLRHQFKEIRDAGLQPGEDTELLRRYRLLENGRRLTAVSMGVSQALSQGERSISEQLGEVQRSLHEIVQLDEERGEAFCTALAGIMEEIDGLADDVSEYGQKIELDAGELQEIESRLELVQKLKRKYGPSLEDVLATQARIRERLQAFQGQGERLKALRERQENAKNEYEEICQELHDARKNAVGGLAAAITEKLHHLGFMKATFDVCVRDAQPSVTGADSVEFLFAPNVGEDMQSLKQTASSGETARVMLAIKTVLSEADSVPILVFDEIDANVGGRVACAVAEELHRVGERHQVFSITHLAQIAAAGDRHYIVEKRVTDSARTETAMIQLDEQKRENELVRMLGGEEGSTAAIGHARELLKQAGLYKK